MSIVTVSILLVFASIWVNNFYPYNSLNDIPILSPINKKVDVVSRKIFYISTDFYCFIVKGKIENIETGKICRKKCTKDYIYYTHELNPTDSGPNCYCNNWIYSKNNEGKAFYKCE